MVFAEGVFNGETLVIHPQKPRGDLEIELRLAKNGPIDMHVKTCVGPMHSDTMTVIELTKHLPQFSMFEMISEPKEEPDYLKECYVTMQVIFKNPNF